MRRHLLLVALSALIASCEGPTEPIGPAPCSLPTADPQVVFLTAGKGATLALLSDGSLWCWGDDPAGACYGGFRPYPMPVIEDRCLLAVSTNAAGIMGIQQGGAARFWDLDGWIQLEEDSSTSSSFGMPRIAQAEPYNTSVALLGEHGELFMVGLVGADADTGREFDGIERVVPPVSPARLSRGGLPCIIGEDGIAYCWTLDEANTPLSDKGDASSLKAVSLPEPIVELAVGNHQSCALTSAGTVYCVGEWVSPDETNPSFQVVYTLPPLDSIKMSEWGATVCGLEGGTLLCWGDNGPDHMYRPDQEDIATPSVVEPFDDIVEYAVGQTHLCVLRENRELWCRGSIGAKGSCSADYEWDVVKFEYCDAFD